MYIPDLAPYTYLGTPAEENIIAVGWLDQEHEFPTGQTPPEILERVLALCFQPARRTRGYHQSPFIPTCQVGYPVEYEGRRMLLGDAEIRVTARTGKVYAAPNLIYHYMKDCGYLPPQEFRDALATD